MIWVAFKGLQIHFTSQPCVRVSNMETKGLQTTPRDYYVMRINMPCPRMSTTEIGDRTWDLVKQGPGLHDRTTSTDQLLPPPPHSAMPLSRSEGHNPNIKRTTAEVSAPCFLSRPARLRRSETQA